MKTLKQNILILAVMCITGAFFFSCDLFDNSGTLVIRLPGGISDNSRAMGGGDLNDDEIKKYLNELKYVIECTGPGLTNKRNAFPGQSISLNLSPGNWNINFSVINKNGRVTGSHSISEFIEAGKSKSVQFSVNLDEPIYMYAGQWEDEFNVIWGQWVSERSDFKLKNFFTKQLTDNSYYHLNLKGFSNKQMDEVSVVIWFYAGDDFRNDWVNWYMIGASWLTDNEASRITNGNFELPLNVKTNFNLDNAPADKLNLINDENRIFIQITAGMPIDLSDGDVLYETKKAAITHFNMNITENDSGLIFTLNQDGKSYSVRGSEATKGAVYIPDTWKGLPVTHIPEWGFCEREITSVILPNRLIEIGKDAFTKTFITSITIPDSVEVIDRAAFFCLKSLEIVEISENSNLKTIGQSAFQETGIKDILIPGSVTSIGTAAFWEHLNLEDIIILAESPPKLIFDKDGNGGHFVGKNDSIPTFHFPSPNILAEYQGNPDWGGRYGAYFTTP